MCWPLSSELARSKRGAPALLPLFERRFDKVWREAEERQEPVYVGDGNTCCSANWVIVTSE
jgi:hypothetical protein